MFGGPEENAVAARFVKDIPLEIRPDGFVIDGRDFPAKDAALRLVFRHPLNPNRTVIIIAGNSADGVFFADRLPDNSDYVIDDGKVAKEDEEMKAALAWGNFDCNWRFNEKYLNFGDPAYRSAAIVRKAPKYLTAAVADRQLMLSDLLESSSAGSFDVMRRDYNWQGRPITLGGKTYSKGIAVMKWDEVCKASYDLTGGNWKRLKATIGIEVDKKPEETTPADRKNTKPLFIVRGDGKELYRSPAIGIDSPPLDIDMDVTGVKVLELEVDREVRGGSAASSLDWADLRLEK